MKKTITTILLSLALLTLASCGHEHTPVADSAVAPTCTATGLTEGSHCSECGEVLSAQEEVAKLEHTAVADKAVAPTCTQVGLTEGSHCSECGEVLTAQEEVAKLEHTAVVDKAVEPTCAATGLTEGSHCSECGEILTAQEEVAKLEHTAVVDKAVEPTCAATGLTEGSHCSECGEVLTAQEEVAKLEHTAVVDKAVEPTCAATGLTEGSHCSECGEVLTAQEEVAKLEHTPTIGNQEIPATCTTTGKSSYTICSVCKVRITEPQTIPTIDHQYRFNYYDTASHKKICTAGCGQTSLENHSFDSANKCKCGYTKTSATVGTKDVVTSIAKNDVAIFNEMSDYSKSADLSRYMEKSKVNGWGKTAKGNCSARVKEFSWLDTNGFAIINVNHNETLITESYILLQSNTNDPNWMSSPLIYRDMNDINNLYGAMGNEVTIALDAFLESLGDYEEVDYALLSKGQFIPQGPENAVANFKKIIADMNTYAKHQRPAPDPLYNSHSRLIVQTNEYKYTITANTGYEYKTYKVTNIKTMTVEIRGERITTVSGEGAVAVAPDIEVSPAVPAVPAVSETQEKGLTKNNLLNKNIEIIKDLELTGNEFVIGSKKKMVDSSYKVYTGKTDVLGFECTLYVITNIDSTSIRNIYGTTDIAGISIQHSLPTMQDIEICANNILNVAKTFLNHAKDSYKIETVKYGPTTERNTIPFDDIHGYLCDCYPLAERPAVNTEIVFSGMIDKGTFTLTLTKKSSNSNKYWYHTVHFYI